MMPCARSTAALSRCNPRSHTASVLCRLSGPRDTALQSLGPRSIGILTNLVRIPLMARAARPTSDRPTSTPARQTWRREQAKARVSEIVRLAREAGPRHVTVHGRDAVVILSAEDFARLSPAATAPTLAALFRTGPFAHLDNFEDGLVREKAPVRDVVEFWAAAPPAGGTRVAAECQRYFRITERRSLRSQCRGLGRRRSARRMLPAPGVGGRD